MTYGRSSPSKSVVYLGSASIDNVSSAGWQSAMSSRKECDMNISKCQVTYAYSELNGSKSDNIQVILSEIQEFPSTN